MTRRYSDLGMLAVVATATLTPVAVHAQRAIVAAVLSPTSASRAAADVLAQSKATYAALQTYSDSGTVLHEFGSNPKNPSKEVHRFHTNFRRPRSFLFDFVKSNAADRYVVWGDDQAFHGWWRTTGLQYDYPKGQGSGAFSGAATQTKGSILLIPPLLFTGAGLSGTLTQFGDAEDDGKEAINGHDCYRITGVAKDVYQTGKEVNVRKVIVWIDVKTMLIRRVFEDTPRSTMANWVSRYYTTFEPMANPKLDDGRFAFTPPSSQP